MSKQNYIDNKRFYDAIVERKREIRKTKKKGKPKPPLSNYLGQCILLIAQNLSHLPRFSGYTSRDEMIMDGCENVCRYFDNYKTKFKNPHAYFTQIIYWAFVRRIKKENDELYARYKLHEQIGVLGETDGLAGGEIANQFQVYNNIGEFIENYETKQKNRKAKILRKKRADARKQNKLPSKTRKDTTVKPKLRKKKRKSKIRQKK